MGALDGKVALVTGAARGQGRSHAVRLAEEGADVVAIDVCAPVETVEYRGATTAELDETVAEVEKLDRRVVARQADVRDLAALQAAVADGVAELGRLDVVVANAGIFTTAPVHELSEEQWNTMIDINLTGVWKTVKATVPTLIEQGTGGSIVLISSTGGDLPQDRTGEVFLDVEVLCESGLTDFTAYGGDPAPELDVFVDELSS